MADYRFTPSDPESFQKGYKMSTVHYLGVMRILLAMNAAVLTSCQVADRPTADIEHGLALVKQAFNDGRLSEALQKARIVRQKDQREARASYYIGLILFCQNQVEMARTAWNDAAYSSYKPGEGIIEASEGVVGVLAEVNRAIEDSKQHLQQLDQKRIVDLRAICPVSTRVPAAALPEKVTATSEQSPTPPSVPSATASRQPPSGLEDDGYDEYVIVLDSLTKENSLRDAPRDPRILNLHRKINDFLRQKYNGHEDYPLRLAKPKDGKTKYIGRIIITPGKGLAVCRDIKQSICSNDGTPPQNTGDQCDCIKISKIGDIKKIEPEEPPGQPDNMEAN